MLIYLRVCESDFHAQINDIKNPKPAKRKKNMFEKRKTNQKKERKGKKEKEGKTNKHQPKSNAMEMR